MTSSILATANTTTQYFFNNISTTYSPSSQQPSQQYDNPTPTYNYDAQQIVEFIVYSLILVTCLFGNILLITAILKFRKLWTEVNLLILNLAFCDVLIALLSIPFTLISYSSTEYLYGPVGCKVIAPLATYGNNASVFTLVLIAVERCLAITRLKPLHKRRILIGIVFVHILALISVIPYIKELTHEYFQGQNYCYEEWYGTPDQKVYTVCLFLIQYGIPLPAMIVLYSISWWKINQQNKRTILLSEDYENKMDTPRSECTSELSVLKETSLLDIVDAVNNEETFSPRLTNNGYLLPSPNQNKKSNNNTMIFKPNSTPDLLDIESHNGTYSSSSLPVFTSRQEGMKRAPTIDKIKTFTRKISTFRKPDFKSQVSVMRHRQTLRTLKMFSSIVTVFAIFALPNQITWIIRDFSGPSEQPSRIAVFIFTTLTYANSMVNCWIYGGFNIHFRKAYRQIFVKTFKCCSHRMFYNDGSRDKKGENKNLFPPSYNAEDEFVRNRRNIFTDIFETYPSVSMATYTTDTRDFTTADDDSVYV